MYIYEVKMDKYSTNDGYIVDIGGDVHIGAVGFDEKAFIRFLHTPYPKILMGDLLEAITPTDKRFSESQHQNPVISAYCYLKHLLMTESKGDILLLLRGNHEQVIFNVLGNFYQNAFKVGDEVISKGGLCQDLGIRYGGSISFLLLYDRKGHKSRWQVAHGNGSMSYRSGEHKRRLVNKKIKIKAMLDCITDADVYFMGHTHRIGVCEPDFVQKLVYDEDEKKMVCRLVADNPRWYVNTGSFVRIYAEGDGNYAEDRLLEPSMIGWVRVRMDKNMHITNIDCIDAYGELMHVN